MPRTARRKPRKPPIPRFAGDHGTGTQAAVSGTVLEPLPTDDGKKDPNNRGRRRRIEVIDHLKFLSLRQYQAAREIRDAYCAVEKLSSGSPLKEHVDANTRPDAVIDVQVDALSRLNRAMAGVPRHHRATVEAVCWHNTPMKDMPDYEVARSDLQGAMTSVANHMNY